MALVRLINFNPISKAKIKAEEAMEQAKTSHPHMKDKNMRDAQVWLDHVDKLIMMWYWGGMVEVWLDFDDVQMLEKV